MKLHDPIKLRRIVAELRDELKKLNDLFTEWEGHRIGEWTDTFFLRGKASIFHDFYCGVENIFQRIATDLNGGLPSSPAWHKTLLQNMLLEIPEVRPPVVSTETSKLLKMFLDFRHMFRHIYGFDLDFEKLDELDKLYPETYDKFIEEVNQFIAFLEKLIAEIEKKD